MHTNKVHHVTTINRVAEAVGLALAIWQRGHMQEQTVRQARKAAPAESMAKL